MATKQLTGIFFLIGSLLIASCQKENSATDPVVSNFAATSSAFTNNGSYPKKYTCDSLGISPPLSWSNAPTGTTSYAITMHHIPGPGEKHVYILLYNIPSTVTSIPEAVSGIGLFGINTVNGNNAYTPLCSQGPGEKQYILTVYALSSAPVFAVPQTQVTMDLLLSAISTKTLGTSIINVTYAR